MQTGRRRYRTERIVRCQIDVVRLAPAGDLARFSQSPSDAQVDARIVRSVFLFDHLAEGPPAGPLLANRDRH